MNSIQYEELCRYFLAQKVGVDIEQILSVRIPNSKRKDFPQYHHQIDLYWEIKNDLCQYLNIANAKWRGSDKVEQGDVLLLQQIKLKVAAHKAMMITSSEFTSGAEAVAKDEGIALHIVKPTFDATILPAKDRSLIQAKIQEVDSSIADQTVYEHVTIHKAFELFETKPSASCTVQNIETSTKIATNYDTKIVGGASNKGSSGVITQHGTSSRGSFTKGGSGGFRTK